MDKLDKIFESLDQESTTSNGFFTSGTGISINGNLIYDSSGNKVTSLRKWKVFGITIWKKATQISVEDFFDKVKKTKKQIQIIDGIVDKYISNIEKAKQFGQTALVEKMEDEIEITKKEALACASGVDQYLTKGQIDNLLKQSNKNIEITPIKNFTRTIPDNLVLKKVKLDADNVFDMYVVMHYDPKKESESLTKKEIARKKDPILFGLIKGSTNMYYIGDWIDEYCNLTLKEVVSIIEDKPKIIC